LTRWVAVTAQSVPSLTVAAVWSDPIRSDAQRTLSGAGVIVFPTFSLSYDR
jgi:hypothetical protein